MTGTELRAKDLLVVLEAVNGGRQQRDKEHAPKGVERKRGLRLRNTQKPKEGNSSQYKPESLDKAISTGAPRYCSSGPLEQPGPGACHLYSMQFLPEKQVPGWYTG